MAKNYYVIVDENKLEADGKCAVGFASVTKSCGLFVAGLDFAKHNGTTPDGIKMLHCDTRRDWVDLIYQDKKKYVRNY